MKVPPTKTDDTTIPSELTQTAPAATPIASTALATANACKAPHLAPNRVHKATEGAALKPNIIQM